MDLSETLLSVNSGEVIRFPVESTSPLAQFQRIDTVSNFGNLRDLAVVQTAIKTSPTISSTDVANLVQNILSSAGASGIMTVQLPDIYIAEGATLVFGGPITVLAANNVNIEGEMLVYGHLNLTCASLGTPPPPLPKQIIRNPPNMVLPD